MIIITFCVLVFLITKIFFRPKVKFPPALPRPHFVQIVKWFLHPHMGKLFSDLGRKIGPICYLSFGPFQLVVLNDAETVKEAFKLPQFSGRSENMYKEFFDDRGFFFSDDTWQKRKFVFKNFRHFGLGGVAAEANINDEICLLFKHFDSFKGKAFSVKYAFNIPTLNGVLHRFMDVKLPHNDPHLIDLLKRFCVVLEINNPIMRACVLAPSLTKWIPSFLSQREFARKLFRDGEEYFNAYSEDHFKSRVPNQPRDFADALMDEVEATTDVNSVFHSSRDPIRPIMFDMIGAAVETTGAMLEWTILYLSHFARVQKKLQLEVDRVVGTERLPELNDRPNMHYLQAFLHEVFRIEPPTPFGYHMALEDTTFRGYTIKKGTTVIGNFYGIHRDPNLWENPDEFLPERFIDAKGQFVKPDNFFAFGSGRRSCVGEVTARDQLFLYVSQIVQTYNIFAEKRLTSMDGIVALNNHAPDFQVKFVRRVINLTK